MRASKQSVGVMCRHGCAEEDQGRGEKRRRSQCGKEEREERRLQQSHISTLSQHPLAYIAICDCNRTYHDRPVDSLLELAGRSLFLLPALLLLQLRRRCAGCRRQACGYVCDLQHGEGQQRAEQDRRGVGDEVIEFVGVQREHDDWVDVCIDAREVGVERLDGRGGCFWGWDRGDASCAGHCGCAWSGESCMSDLMGVSYL